MKKILITLTLILAITSVFATYQSISGSIGHIPQFGGNIYYVSPTGNDTNSGTSPTLPLLTIGAAFGKMIDGDAVIIMAGTYTEIGLDLGAAGTVDNLEIWFETGTIIDPVSGTALTVSGDNCLIKGNHKITPAAGAIGLLVSGTGCYINDGRIVGGGTGISFTGVGCFVTNYGAASQTTTAYAISASQVKMTNCSTKGIGATYGYLIASNSDTGVLRSCSSVGHTTSGYYISSGCDNWTIVDCSSGSGDGKNRDIGSTNIWSNYLFDDIVYKTITFAGGSPGGVNAFKITGIVEIEYIYGHITTVLNADVGNLKLEVYDGSASDLTTTANVSSAPLDSFIGKTSDTSSAITYETSASAYIVENSNYRDPQVKFVIGAKRGTSTYIRCNVAGVATDGAIHWHCKYKPVSDDGFIEVAP